MSFLDNILKKDDAAKKLQKEIEGIEFKKQSLISSVQSEIQGTKQKIENEIYQIGLNIYTRYVNGEYTDDALDAQFKGIISLNEVITEREAKIKEIAGRYDEELGMLKSNLDLMHSQSAVVSGGAACSNCKNPYTPGKDTFCTGCGQKLDAEPVVAGTICSNCKSPYTPGKDAFCTGCGQKLN